MTADIENKTVLPAIPEIPEGIDPQTADFLRAIKETFDTYQGNAANANSLDAVITKRDLFELGMAAVAVDDQIVSYENESGSGEEKTIIAKGEGQGVYPTPPIPTLVVVTGTPFNIIIEWGQISYNGHYHTEIWRSSVNDIGQASLIGVSRSLIFFDDIGVTDTTRYYWIRFVNKALKAGQFHTGAAEGSVGSSSLVVSDDIASVSAEKIITSTLSAIVANLGTITAGILQSSDSTMKIDLNAKEIMIAGSGGQSSDDYMLLTDGVIEFYKYEGGTHHLYKTLRHRENGVADSGDTVQIPGYFDEQPDIIVGPNNTQTYSASNSGQDQSLELKAENINEYATGQWEFDAVARLILSDNSGNTVVNDDSGSQSSDTYTTTLTTTPASTVEFTVNIRLTSVRGTGTAPDYHNRDVEWRIGYRDNAVGGAYTYTSYQTKAIGDQLSSVIDARTVTGLAAKAYDIIIEYVSDDVSTDEFSSGSPGYTYAEDTQDNLTTTSVVTSSAVNSTGNSTVNDSDSVTLDMGAYSAPAGWEVYNVNYEFEYSYSMSFSETGGAPTHGGALNHGLVSDDEGTELIKNIFGTGPPIPSSENYGNLTSYTAGSYSKTTYDQNMTLNTFAQAFWTASSSGHTLTLTTSARLRNAEATIQRRQASSNSSTADNRFELLSYDYVLTGSTTLATGSLNWAAIGE